MPILVGCRMVITPRAPKSSTTRVRKPVRMTVRSSNSSPTFRAIHLARVPGTSRWATPSTALTVADSGSPFPPRAVVVTALVVEDRGSGDRNRQEDRQSCLHSACHGVIGLPGSRMGTRLAPPGILAPHTDLSLD